MRLYHRTTSKFPRSFILLLLAALLYGCSAPQATQAQIAVVIIADNKEFRVDLPQGSTVNAALNYAKITLNTLDRVEPPAYTELSVSSFIKVTRIHEEFYTDQVIIPFEQQELRNEALAEGDVRLIQAGKNGLVEITYRRVIEEDIETSEEPFKSVILLEAIPEIVMVGSKPLFTEQKIPGRLAYLSAGNAWVIEGSTSSRRCVVSSGDLDGRIFSLSPKGNYLLYTRINKTDQAINSLWAVELNSNPDRQIDLGVENIVHFAEINPGIDAVAYSTVEWRETAPGWQANNDLLVRALDGEGTASATLQVMDKNSGGMYGWWGTVYSWAPVGSSLLFARPDSIGVLNIHDKLQSSILSIIPYETGGSWAWVPGTAWSPDGNVIYAVTHVISNKNTQIESDQFDLLALPLTGGKPVDLVKNVGMFAYPETSPGKLLKGYFNNSSGESHDQNWFSVAYLQALLPGQSEDSKYQLYVIDKDGSNQKKLFPLDENSGFVPQHITWSPESVGANGEFAIALIYNGNIWMIDTGTGVAQQITGDGLTQRVDWR